MRSRPEPSAWGEITLADAFAGAAAPAPRTASAPLAGAALQQLVGAPADARARLARLDLLVVGLGAVGGPFVDYLAALAPGTIRLVDPDWYVPGNLQSQPIGPEALGRPKVEVVGRRLKARSPSTRVLVAPCRFEELDVGAVHASVAVAVAGDSLALTAAVSQRACELGQALFQGSVHGPTCVAQVRHTAPVEGRERKCLCCHWDAGERRELEHQTRFACDGSGRVLGNPAGPSGALSALGGLAGSLMAFELLRWALGLEGSADSIVEYCALSGRSVVSPLAPKRRCLVEHAPWRKVHAARELGELSLRQVFALAHPRSPRRLAPRSLEIDGWRWVASGLCECDVHPTVNRFVRQRDADAALAPCARCGRAVRVHPFHEHARAPGVLFAACAERSLAELGASRARAAIVRGSSGAVLVLGPECGERAPLPCDSMEAGR